MKTTGIIISIILVVVVILTYLQLTNHLNLNLDMKIEMNWGVVIGVFSVIVGALILEQQVWLSGRKAGFKEGCKQTIHYIREKLEEDNASLDTLVINEEDVTKCQESKPSY